MDLLNNGKTMDLSRYFMIIRRLRRTLGQLIDKNISGIPFLKFWNVYLHI